MPRVASLYLPNLSTDRVRASEREGRRSRKNPSPAFCGRGGAQAEGLGGEGLADSAIQTLPSHRFAAGPSSPVKDGRGVYLPRAEAVRSLIALNSELSLHCGQSRPNARSRPMS